MANRVDLQTKLEALLGSTNVYFQPPATVKRKYPCIQYERNRIDTKFADNFPYTNKTSYSVTVIDENPDSSIPGLLGSLPMCMFDRHFTADNLNHDVYTIYF